MSLLGNLIWIIIGGLFTSILYIICGLVFCLTIIGIPFGIQLIKIGVYAFMPFGKDFEFADDEPGCLSTVGNLLWILMGWWEIAILHLLFGLLFCVTIVGIPLGMQHFKLAKISLFPFGQHSVIK